MRVSPVEIGLLAGAAVVVAVALPTLLERRRRRTVVRASWTLTPGVLNPAVTQATIRTTICTRGWTRTIRPPVSLHERAQGEGSSRSTGCAGRCRRSRRTT